MAGVAIGGFMGVGKSTVGRALAQRLGLPFIDSDEVLASRFGPTGLQLREHGEPLFRARERAVIEELAAGPAAVVATGGGAWVDPGNRAALRRGGARLVVLHAPFDVLAARVGGDPARPLFDEGARTRYEARRAAYADCDLRVDVTGRPPSDIVEEIVQWLSSTP